MRKMTMYDNYVVEFYQKLHDLWLSGDLADDDYIVFFRRAVYRSQVWAWIESWQNIRNQGMFEDVQLLMD